MNNTGKSNTDEIGEDQSPLDNEKTNQRSPIFLLGLVGVLLVFLVIGFQAFGILYSIIFPPRPPLPPNMTEIRHTAVDHGVDEWLYQTNMDACELVQYYEDAGGICTFPTGSCVSKSPDEPRFSTSGEHVATCVGTEQFNIFAYRWEANIADSYLSDVGSTKFTAFREVFWTGAVPPRLDPRQGFEFGE